MIQKTRKGNDFFSEVLDAVAIFNLLRSFFLQKLWHKWLLPLLLILFCLSASQSAYAEKPVFVTPPSQPTEVKIGLYLIAIDKISPTSSTFPTFDAEMFLDMKWHDPRLAFDPEKVGTDREVFQEHAAELKLERIWWPDIEIENGQGGRKTEKLILIISADGMVEYEERFVVTIETNFDLHQFPFDQQDLEVDIESFAWDERYVVFVPMKEKIGNKTDHAGSEWRVTDVSTEIRSEREIRSDHDFSEFIFNVHVERLPGYYLWHVSPLFIIIVLSWSAFWMEGEAMPGRMGRSFIALLTVVAFHRIISNMMPHIFYMTFLDSMVLIAYFFTGIGIIENVIVNRHEVKGDHDRANLIDRRARWLVPLSFVILSGLSVLIYFT